LPGFGFFSFGDFGASSDTFFFGLSLLHNKILRGKNDDNTDDHMKQKMEVLWGVVSFTWYDEGFFEGDSQLPPWTAFLYPLDWPHAPHRPVGGEKSKMP